MKSAPLILLLLLVACGPNQRSDNFGDGGNGSGSGSGSNAGGGCSSDLHDVLDANGNVIATCPATQGCAAGVCVDACQAAAASQGSVGCDFTVATPSFYSFIQPPCFAVFLANNWPTDSVVTIDRGGTSYSATTFGRVPDGTANAATWPVIPATGIPSSNVGVLFLGNDPSSNNAGRIMACPVTAAVSITGGSAVYTGTNAASGLGTAFHIHTSSPVSAYDVLPYGGASSYLPSAELLLPSSAWGTNYVTAGPEVSQGPGWGQVVAMMDNTSVQITPKNALPGGPGVAAAPAQVTTTYTLAAGQYIQWQDAGDMAGSVISSTNPVSFTGGTGYLCLQTATSTGGGCDSGNQLIPPVSALGSEYVAPPYATRRADLQPESILYRFVGAVDGTALAYKPAVPGAPASISLGQVIEFQSTIPFVVTSQDAMHPFYVGQYMSGCSTTSGSRPGDLEGCLGDEEFVNILPPAQWLSSYVFFTDPTYTTTNLVIVRKVTATGFQDVTVDCLGVIGGWQPVADGATYQITNVDLQRGAPVGTCTNGRHTTTSAGGFNVMVWGLASAASYAYPAGGNVGKINPVVVIGRQI
ncbi:hypothetical protein BH11MYX1_BH11MYX1_28500 [soil metagenome]